MWPTKASNFISTYWYDSLIYRLRIFHLLQVGGWSQEHNYLETRMRRSVALVAVTATLVVAASMAVPFQPTQAAIGNVCSTAVGRYPGRSNPLGSACTVATPRGPASGVVTQ